MKILIVNPALRPVCGRTAMVLHLARELHARGHTVVLLTDECSNPGLLDGLPFELRLTRMNPDRKSPTSVLALRKALHSAVADVQPDIVHTHHRYPAYIAGRWADLGTARHVSTVHSHVEGRKRFRIRAEQWVAVSASVKTWLAKQLAVDPAQIEVIYNGTRVQPQRADLAQHFEQRGLCVLAAGRFSHEKGFDVLLESWKEFIAQTDRPARLTIAGAGPEEARLRELVGDMHDSVVITNGAGRMEELYSEANLVVVPSRTEALSYILLEAGMRGIPLIVSDSGGPAELVTQQRTGLIVPPDAVPPLARALRDAEGNYGAMLEYGRQLRPELIERHSINAMTDAYIRLYERMIRAADYTGVEETIP